MARTILTDEISIAQPLVIRNTRRGPSHFADPTLGLEYDWEGFGDPAGEDEQIVSPRALQSPAFMKNVISGTFEVVDASDEIMAAIQQASERPRAVQARKEALRKENESAAVAPPVITPSDVNDIVTEKCLGPGTRQGSHCENEIPTKKSALGKQAPLCSTHENLRNFAVEEETGQLDADGKPIWSWHLAQLTRY